MSLTELVILSAMTYRIARFLVKDTLIEVTRDRFYGWLADHPSGATMKLMELMQCPYCLTIWVAAGSTLFWELLVDQAWSGWGFVGTWLAAATGGLVFWRIIDGDS